MLESEIVLGNFTPLGMVKHLPPAAKAAYDAANARRAAEVNRQISNLPAGAKVTARASQGFVAVKTSKPQPSFQVVAKHEPKGSEPAMPAAAPTAKVKERPSLKARNREQAPQHILPQLKAFKGPDAARNAYAASQVLRAAIGRLTHNKNIIAEDFCLAHGFDVTNIATESSPTSGGYLTPDPLTAAIVELKARVGVSRQLAEVVPMSSDTLGVPKETGGYTVQYPNEAGAISSSDLSWGLINLNAEKRVVLGFASNELMDDAVLSFTDIFASRAAHSLAAQEDNEFCNADGTSSFGGEVGLKGAIGAGGIAVAATGHNAFDELDLSDFVSCMAKLPAKFANGGEAWLVNPIVYALGMLKSVGGASQGFDAEGRPLFLGRPVYLSSKAPATSGASTIAAYYGSFSEGVTIGDRVGFSLSLSQHVKFDYDLTALKGSARYDINCHECGDATNAGAVVALATAS